jgi:hypothetical protein
MADNLCQGRQGFIPDSRIRIGVAFTTKQEGVVQGPPKAAGGEEVSATSRKTTRAFFGRRENAFDDAKTLATAGNATH